MKLASAIVTLFLIMGPIGNVPTFLSLLRDVDERRRTRVVARESCFALGILMLFLFFGPALMKLLHVGQPALSISGGVLLFLISLGMIFPLLSVTRQPTEQKKEGEPFIVPLATPLLAGPASMAAITILVSQEPERFWQWCVALFTAWAACTAILVSASPISRVLGPRGLIACERLTGMVLTVISVQMFLEGIRAFAT